MKAILLVLLALMCATAAHAKDWHHDDDCEDAKPQPECVDGYDWLYFVAINAKCEAAQRWHIDEPGRRFTLCYIDRDGGVYRHKMLRYVPFAEAQFEADMRNQAQCQ